MGINSLVGIILGKYDETNWPDSIGMRPSYFVMRGILLDLRGNVTISKDSAWGYNVKLYSATHYFDDGKFAVAIRNVRVEVMSGAFIGSESVLYNCIIKKNSIVSIGSVVRTMVVPEYTVVAGNPARVTNEWDGEKWKIVRRVF